VLTPGSRVGAYEIGARIGVGGMGEVYRARDVNLARQAAIKVLPQAVASDPALLARLEREAKTLASLSHSNIAAIYGLERSGDGIALAMELVEGPTLADRIADGRLPVDEALSIARQIAQALEAAHEHGIVHRDLKPANVKLRADGAVKVLDFGLAKVVEPHAATADAGASSLPTAADMTEVGVVLGTAAYMSPEQARGQPVDKRTDLWAFGCVFYEMLTGKRAFDGRDSVEILAAVIRGQPDWAALPEDLPAAIRSLIQGCLSKERADRIADVSTVRFLLRHTESRTGEPATSRSHARFWWPVAVGAAVAVAGAGGMFVSWLMAQRGDSSLVQATLPAPPGTVLRETAGFSLSPDGSRLAFVAQDADGIRHLWIRPLAALEAVKLAGTEGAFAPFWSPDGRDLGFFADQRLKRVPAAGGAAQTLAQGTVEPKGGAWSPDGRIVYVPDFRTGLCEVPATGGEARELTTRAAGETSHRWPQFFPDGRTILFLVQTAEAGAPDDRSRVEALTADGIRHEVIAGNASALYAPSGELLYWREGSIYAQRLDIETFELAGEPVAVARGVGLTQNEWPTFTISATGTLVYHDASRVAWRLEWRDRSGRLLSVAAPEGEYSEPALSRDGRRVAYVENFTTLRLLDLARGTNTRLSFEDVDHFSSAWSRAGDWLAYAANKATGPGSEIYRHSTSGSGERELVYASDAGVVRGVSWAPDGRTLAFEENGDIFVLDLASGAVRTAVDTRGYAWSPRFSPDGRWLAYVSDDSGRDEVYVTAADGAGGRIQASNSGAREPEWSAGSGELFFLALDGALQVAPIGAGADGRIGVPETLFSIGTTGVGRYQVAPDGALLVRAQIAIGNPHGFTLVQSWPKLLE
jgi:Tol biopolymer transport system component